jgi:AcrR family transcriptional regulator
MTALPALPEDLPTADRILSIAEAMFAEHGYRSVSLRSVTRACNANIAAIHYHFGSKEELLERIFAKRCGIMNSERLRLLDQCEEASDRPPLLEQVIEAYLRPSLVWPDDDEGWRRFMRLRAVIAHEREDLARNLIARHFNAVSRRFIAALRTAAPHLSEQEVYWRFHFLLGAHYYTLSNPGRIQLLSDNKCDPSDTTAALRQLVPFVAAGFHAPSIKPLNPQKRKPRNHS